MRESARIMAKDLGETPEAFRKKIARGKEQMGQHVPKLSDPKPPEITRNIRNVNYKKLIHFKKHKS